MRKDGRLKEFTITEGRTFQHDFASWTFVTTKSMTLNSEYSCFLFLYAYVVFMHVYGSLCLCTNMANMCNGQVIYYCNSISGIAGRS